MKRRKKGIQKILQQPSEEATSCQSPALNALLKAGTASSNAVLETKKISPQKKGTKNDHQFFCYRLLFDIHTTRHKEGKVSVIRRRVVYIFIISLFSRVLKVKNLNSVISNSLGGTYTCIEV